nr:protein C54E4.4 [imported] - Caenorhabditis elegans [Caenorhabditis elegans]
MPLDYQSEDGTTSSRNGIPNGALTVEPRHDYTFLNALNQRQGQTVLRLSPASALSSPTGDTVRPASFPPMYIVSPSYDPKFDAPPSYEDAVRTMVQNGEPGLPNQTVITIPEHSQSTSSSSSLESGAARIDVEMTQHHHVPTTSGLTV